MQAKHLNIKLKKKKKALKKVSLKTPKLKKKLLKILFYQHQVVAVEEVSR